MTRREKRLLAFLGAHLRVLAVRPHRADPKLADATILQRDKAEEKLTRKDMILICAASRAARDAAYDQVIYWNSAEGMQEKADRIRARVRPARKEPRSTDSLRHI